MLEEEILFQITKDKLETGMRGFPVGYCTTSFVDPQKGLFYIDKSVSALSSWDPIQVIYLLYFGKEGSAQEIEKFSKDLHQRSRCHREVVQAVQKLPRQGHPMKLFCASLLMLGMF